MRCRLISCSSITLLLLGGCGSSGDSAISASEMAAATVSGAVQTGARSSGALGLAFATNTCPTPTTGIEGQGCDVDPTGHVLTLSYSECNFGNNSAVWSGSEILTSSAPVACGELPSQLAGATLLRTLGEGTTRTVGSSVHIASIDTSSPSGFETPVSGGTLLSFKEGGAMNVEIKGVHILSQKIFRGDGRGDDNEGRIRTEADHTISSGPDALVVTQANSSRVVNGTLKVQHNLEKYTGTSVFKDVTFADTKACCFPSSGTITTTFSGSRTDSEVLTFSGETCGAARMNDSKGGLKDVTLTRCF